MASPFHPKARLWIRGRRHWRRELQQHRQAGSSWIWFHAASLGEFEQGRNLIEAIKEQHPQYKILLTFFSPSGYEVRKNYPLADWVCYLPLDHPQNARDFLEIVRPALGVFIKYELWLNYLAEFRRRELPVILISASVTEESRFFRSPFAPLYKEGFLAFQAIFTQNDTSARLIESFCGHPRVLRSADTRYDRVKANRESFQPIPAIEAFTRDRFCLVAGSTWPVDEDFFLEVWDLWEGPDELVFILAPHEIQKQRIHRWISKYPELSLPYSRIGELNSRHRILWIDNIGMLSRLYHYADWAYVGGGFSGKLHNILEAAAFGCPLSFGPRFQRFPEAVEMVALGGAFPVASPADMVHLLEGKWEDEKALEQLHVLNRSFVDERAGATAQILAYCRESGWLEE